MTAVLRRYPAALLIGGYAAAIAVAPTPAAKLALCVPLVAIPLVVWNALSARAWIGLFFACALLVPPLPIQLGDTGPHAALLFVAAGIAAGVVRARQWTFPGGLLPFATAALFAILLGSVTLAAVYSGPAIALGSFARVLLFGIGVYVFFYAAYGPAEYTNANLRRATQA